MQQLTQEERTTSTVDILMQLRQSLAGADPFASSESEPFLTQAHALAKTLHTASASDREALLLRALDEAIAAIEIAASVADALHDTQHTRATKADSDGGEVSAPDPLVVAYRAFAESQPAYQGLYHYRNAVAEHIRDARGGAGGAQ